MALTAFTFDFTFELPFSCSPESVLPFHADPRAARFWFCLEKGFGYFSAVRERHPSPPRGTGRGAAVPLPLARRRPAIAPPWPTETAGGFHADFNEASAGPEPLLERNLPPAVAVSRPAGKVFGEGTVPPAGGVGEARRLPWGNGGGGVRAGVTARVRGRGPPPFPPPPRPGGEGWAGGRRLPDRTERNRRSGCRSARGVPGQAGRQRGRRWGPGRARRGEAGVGSVAGGAGPPRSQLREEVTAPLQEGEAAALPCPPWCSWPFPRENQRAGGVDGGKMLSFTPLLPLPWTF